MNRVFRLIGLTMLGILLTGGLLASVFVHSIEAALTVSPSSRVAPVNIPTTPRITPGTVKTPGAVTTPASINILSQDTFQRADQLSWGTASDGHPWGADAANKNVFSITGKNGQIANGHGTFDATLGPVIADAGIQFSGSINQFNQSNLGAVLRWTDTNDWYKAYIDGARIVVLKRVAGMTTRLGAFLFPAKPGVVYALRFQVIGTTLSAKVWQTRSIEPPNWMVMVTDNTFQNGYGGLRVLLENGIVVKITSFKETTVVANA